MANNYAKDRDLIAEAYTSVRDEDSEYLDARTRAHKRLDGVVDLKLLEKAHDAIEDIIVDLYEHDEAFEKEDVAEYVYSTYRERHVMNP